MPAALNFALLLGLGALQNALRPLCVSCELATASPVLDREVALIAAPPVLMREPVRFEAAGHEDLRAALSDGDVRAHLDRSHRYCVRGRCAVWVLPRSVA